MSNLFPEPCFDKSSESAVTTHSFELTPVMILVRILSMNYFSTIRNWLRARGTLRD